MKQSILASTVAVFLLFAGEVRSQVQPVKLTSATDMKGAYTMLKQVADTGTGEFHLNTQQMKIFTDKYVMYAHRRSETDSMAEFGIGKYSVENGKVIEQMFFGASGPINNKFELAINKQKDGYSQIIHFPENGSGRRWVLTEDYAKMGTSMKSPLDGAWRMKKLIIVDKDGKSTTYESSDKAKQFKLYESGNFMWANYVQGDEVGKVNTAYGYGTFEMSSPNQITETITSSTYQTLLVGNSLTFNIKFIGKDIFEQSNTWENGSKRIEVYERLN